MLLAFALSLPAPCPQEPPAEHLPLRVLYAGNAGTPYSKAWTTFLAAHTDTVRAVAGRTLQPADLVDIDVLILDGEVEDHTPGGEMQLVSEHVPLQLRDLQGVPVLLMGGEGGFFSDDNQLKTSWRHG